MLNRSASLAMSTSVLKALPGKLDIKRHSPNFDYLATKFVGQYGCIGGGHGRGDDDAGFLLHIFHHTYNRIQL